MGAKYELKFLVNIDSRKILTDIYSIMNKKGWSYNKLLLGRYAFWKSGPIWNFGNSIDFSEKQIDENEDNDKLEKIFKEISKFYSQAIFINKIVNNKISTSVISIIESEFDLTWKEVLVAFELSDLLEENETNHISNDIKEIFVAISEKIKPHYALASTESAGLVDNPKLLIITKEILGDFNYFSYKCDGFELIEDFEKDFEIISFENEGKFIFTTKIICPQQFHYFKNNYDGKLFKE